MEQLDWREEARCVLRDIEPHVHRVWICTREHKNGSLINLETREGDKFCVHLDEAGFRVVGRDFDRFDEPAAECYETPYALLTALSAGYINAFHQSLTERLQAVAEKRN